MKSENAKDKDDLWHPKVKDHPHFVKNFVLLPINTYFPCFDWLKNTFDLNQQVCWIPMTVSFLPPFSHKNKNKCSKCYEFEPWKVLTHIIKYKLSMGFTLPICMFVLFLKIMNTFLENNICTIIKMSKEQGSIKTLKSTPTVFELLNDQKQYFGCFDPYLINCLAC